MNSKVLKEYLYLEKKKKTNKLISPPVKILKKAKNLRKQNTFITKVWIALGCFWSLLLKLSSKFPTKKKKIHFSRQNAEELEGSDFLTRWQSWGGNPDLCVLLTLLLLLAATEEAELPVWFSADCMHCKSQNSQMFLLYSTSLRLVKDVVIGYSLIVRDPGFCFAAIVSCDLHLAKMLISM